MVFALCRLVLPDHRRVHHVCSDRICHQGASCATSVHVWLRAQGGTWSSVELSSGRRAFNSVRKVSFFPQSQVIETIMPAVPVDAPGSVFLHHQTRQSPGIVCRHVQRLSWAVCSAFVTAQRKAGKSGRSEEMILPMNFPEELKGSIEARRFPRYEIDTEIHVAMFRREKQ